MFKSKVRVDQEELDELIHQDLFRLYQNEYGQYLTQIKVKEKKKRSIKRQASKSKNGGSLKNLILK
jgi:hypothetical protein